MSTSSSAEQVLQLSHSIDLESMKLNIKYLSIGLGVITGIILSLTLLKRDGGNRSTEIGPGETVIAFHTALTEGNIALAKSLCITLSMEEYINAYSDALSAKTKQDSCTAAIAAGILSNAEVVIDEIKREGDTRLAFYTIYAGEGMKKSKVAVLKKEEGAWKVGSITDRQ